MSTFLGFESYLIPLGSTRDDIHTTIRAALTSKGWRIVRDSLAVKIESIIGTLGQNAANREICFQDQYPVNTTWSTSNNSDQKWLGVKFVNPVNVRKVVMFSDADANNAVSEFTIDYSDNGTDWTIAATFTDVKYKYPYVRRSFAVPDSGSHLYWRINCLKSVGRTTKGISRLCFCDQYGSYGLKPDYAWSWFETIPPVTEQVGDEHSRDMIRFNFSNTEIAVFSVSQAMRDFPQVVYVQEVAGGSGVNSNSVTITAPDGTAATVSQDPATLNAANTSKQNLRFLFDAVRKSTEPLFLAYDWKLNLPATQNNPDNFDHIIGTAKVAATTDNAISGTNCSAGVTGLPVESGMVNDWKHANLRKATIDLVNGFIYYMQVCSRGIAFAIKTNTAFSSVIWAAYADHDKAMAVRPNSPWCSVIELMIGQAEDANNMDSYAAPGHYWAMSDRLYGFRVESRLNWYNDQHVNHTFGQGCNRYELFDTLHGWANDDRSMQLLGSNLWVDNQEMGNDFQIHRLSSPRVYMHEHSWLVIGNYIAPQLDITDMFKFRGTAVNEALVLVADTQSYSTLAVDIDVAANPTSIEIANASTFNSTGFVCIGDELFQYTGISGNTLTGVSRAKYGTKASWHYTTENVHQCLWFTIIGGGALLCGFNRPV